MTVIMMVRTRVTLVTLLLSVISCDTRQGDETCGDNTGVMTVIMTVRTRVTLVTLLLSVISCDTRQDTGAMASLESGAVTEITSMVGSSVSLPCNMTSNTPGDRVRLMLWFRE